MPSSPKGTIDLNADVGEGEGEEPLYALITTANVACGGHAGNDDTMRRAVGLAMRYGVALGAHPSYPDRAGFGRVTRSLEPGELSRTIADQIAALARIAEEAGARLVHVKPHGALYNDAAARPEIADAIAAGVASISRSMVLVGLAGSRALSLWRQLGFEAVGEGFADRRYAPDGTLVPRAHALAVITDPAEAAAQAVRLAVAGTCSTICVHGDTPESAAIASAVRLGLEAAGFSLNSRRRESHGSA